MYDGPQWEDDERGHKAVCGNVPLLVTEGGEKHHHNGDGEEGYDVTNGFLHFALIFVKTGTMACNDNIKNLKDGMEHDKVHVQSEC